MRKQDTRSVVIFGGAGFIGSNLAHSLLSYTDAKVHIFDNLSRAGVHHNVEWLRKTAGNSGRLQVTVGDVRDVRQVEKAVAHATEIYHFAAQVAVTTSLVDPRHDFEVNLAGTFNVLEALRGRDVPLVFASTNKVYGALAGVHLSEGPGRWEPSSAAVRHHGVSEATPMQFASPYGCSKGAADQYVLDHADCFGMPNVVFRMSCIYGPHQFGTEDQGWVSHFIIAA